VARDPASWALYGTNQAIASTDNSAGNAESWTLIDSGGVALPDSRLTAGPAVTVNNANSYSSYRLVFPTVKDSNSANSVQIAEVQLFESTDASTQPILSPGNPILAVHLGSSQSSSPLLEGPASAVDGNVSTKYLNFGEARAGLILGPSIGPETVVTSFVITTANDSPERDPSSFELYGTNDPIMSPNHGLGIEGGEVWTLLASGLIDLPLARLTAGAPVAVSNADPYSAYRIIFPSVRNEAAANSVQFAEIQFDGQVVSDGGSVPEPASWALVLLTLSLLAACRRRSFALRRRG
jgi:hypothetical protein